MPQIKERTIKGIYRNGKIEPEGELRLAEGAQVEIVLPAPTKEQRNAAIREFAGSLSHEDAEHVRRFVEANFERIDEELWK